MDSIVDGIDMCCCAAMLIILKLVASTVEKVIFVVRSSVFLPWSGRRENLLFQRTVSSTSLGISFLYFSRISWEVLFVHQNVKNIITVF